MAAAPRAVRIGQRARAAAPQARAMAPHVSGCSAKRGGLPLLKTSGLCQGKIVCAPRQRNAVRAARSQAGRRGGRRAETVSQAAQTRARRPAACQIHSAESQCGAVSGVPPARICAGIAQRTSAWWSGIRGGAPSARAAWTRLLESPVTCRAPDWTPKTSSRANRSSDAPAPAALGIGAPRRRAVAARAAAPAASVQGSTPSPSAPAASAARRAARTRTRLPGRIPMPQAAAPERAGRRRRRRAAPSQAARVAWIAATAIPGRAAFQTALQAPAGACPTPSRRVAKVSDGVPGGVRTRNEGICGAARAAPIATPARRARRRRVIGRFLGRRGRPRRLQATSMGRRRRGRRCRRAAGGRSRLAARQAARRRRPSRRRGSAAREGDAPSVRRRWRARTSRLAAGPAACTAPVPGGRRPDPVVGVRR